jgi:hypothetical protein
VDVAGGGVVEAAIGEIINVAGIACGVLIASPMTVIVPE